MKKSLLVILVALAGCTGVDGKTHLGMPGSPVWYATATPATQAAYFRDRCISYGFRAGTPAMAQCIQLEAVTGRRDASARASEAFDEIAEATKPQRPVHTTCNRFGGTVNCTSF